MKETVSFPLRLLFFAITVVIVIGIWATGIYPPSKSNVYYLIYPGFVLLTSCFFIFSPRHRIFSHLLVCLASTGLTLILLDLLLRIAVPGLLYYRPHEMFAQRHPEMPFLKRYKPNVCYWGETHGDMAAMSGNETLREKRNILFQTDSFGFRNKSSSHGAKYNLIILGDSFAVGNGTTQDATWPSLLSSKYNLTIYNLSMAGGPWQHYINLKVEYRRLKVQPGTIILLTVFTGNDLDNYYGSTSNEIELSKIGLLEHWKTATGNFRNRSPIARVFRQVLIQLDADKYADRVVTRKFLGTRSMAFFRPYVQRKDRCKDDIISHPNYLPLNNVLSNLKDFCEKNSLQLNIMLMPSKAEVYEWLVDRMPPWSTSTHPSGFSSIVQAFCEKNGIGFLDLKPFLINESRRIWNHTKACLWWYDDTHMNPAGHQAVAAAVYDQLLAPILKKSENRRLCLAKDSGRRYDHMQLGDNVTCFVRANENLDINHLLHISDAVQDNPI